jgi:hypothetical protein
MLHDATEELHDELGRDERRVLRGDVEHRVHLDEIEADHLGVARHGDERGAELPVGESAEFRDGDDVVAAGAGIVDVRLPRVQAPDADLDDPPTVARRATFRMGSPFAHCTPWTNGR